MSDLAAVLGTAAEAIGQPLDSGQVAQCLALMRLIRDWNRATSLVAEEDDEALLHKHLVDSLLFCGPLGEFGGRLADIGSGGGLPGLVLKIALPQVPVTLIESHQRRAQFLAEAAQELGLQQLTVLPQRVEEVGRDAAHREGYARVTARRLAELAVLCEYALPLLAPGGLAVLAKGVGLDDELAAAAGVPELLGGAPPTLCTVDLPAALVAAGEPAQRRFVRVSKVAPTPAKYPRPPGRPSKRPLRTGG